MLLRKILPSYYRMKYIGSAVGLINRHIVSAVVIFVYITSHISKLTHINKP
jgi:hypothetical protein